MKVITIANHKGGVGKTTTAMNVGAGLAEAGGRVLMIDLDSQRNLTGIFLPDYDGRTVIDALRDGGELPTVQVRERLALIPSALTLTASAVTDVYSLRRLVPPEYEWVVIDCPPSLDSVTTLALFATDRVIIPLTAEVLPLKGLGTLVDYLTAVEEARGAGGLLGGIVLTRYDGRKTLSRMVAEQVRDTYGDKVFRTMIRDNVAIAEAQLSGKTVTEYAPKSNGAKDYADLTAEVLKW